MRWIIIALMKWMSITLITIFSLNAFAMEKFTCTGGRPAWKLDIDKWTFKLQVSGTPGKVFFYSVKPVMASPTTRVYGTTSYNWIPAKIVVKDQSCGGTQYKVNFAYGNKIYSGCCIRGDLPKEIIQRDKVPGVVQYGH